ncbi:hypothetical protein NFI96_003869 [Prochilodus magdalenae]|nr:hypothetical protein NFI96_003869 [Prochilodus magdalenae]
MYSAILADMDSTPKKLQLKPEVGLAGGVSLIAGVMIGSGIFISPQTMLQTIGSPGAGLVIWACSGLIATLASLSYAELGTVIRESGGEYIYIMRTSCNPMAFMFAFTYLVVIRPSSTAAQALVFAKYVIAPYYGECPPPVVMVKCLAAVGILLVSMVNCLNVRCSIRITMYLTVTKFLTLAVIGIGGLVVIIQGNTAKLQNTFEGTNPSISAIGMAFFQCLWSYGGWNNLNFVTEELKRPEVVLQHFNLNPR